MLNRAELLTQTLYEIDGQMSEPLWPRLTDREASIDCTLAIALNPRRGWASSGHHSHLFVRGVRSVGHGFENRRSLRVVFGSPFLLIIGGVEDFAAGYFVQIAYEGISLEALIAVSAVKAGRDQVRSVLISIPAVESV